MTNKEYWESLWTNPHEHVTKYREFMHNRGNMYKCTECPHEGDGYSGPGIVGPCGQQHCWVKVHCDDLQDDDE
jgi:hypothetical protein